MKLSLRKAHALETSMLAKSIELDSDCDLSINFSHYAANLSEIVLQTQKKFAQGSKDILELINASFVVRRLLTAANNKAGINDLLSEKAELQRQESFLNKYRRATAVDIDLEQRKIDAQKARTELNRYGNDSSAINCANQEIIDYVKSELDRISRRKVEIADLLLGKNLTETVDIPESVVDIATEYGLL